MRELNTLSKAGYSAYLIVADGFGDSADIDGDVKFIDVGAPRGRLYRFFITTFKVYRVAVQVDANIYHFHDPELLFCGIFLKLSGKKVIFDVHEDVAKQILTKEYLNKYSAKLVSFIYKRIENILSKYYDGIIGATSLISRNFKGINDNICTIFNYPPLNELHNSSDRQVAQSIVYVGSISKERGLLPLINALNQDNAVTLNLAGSFSDKKFEAEVKTSLSWTHVNYYGQLNRDAVKELLSTAIAGVVTFLPAPNHIDALPNKIFEYMSAGLPIIASNFPLWASIIQDSGAGICVDPTSISEISTAIDYLKNNKEAAVKMGQIGRRLVEKQFNWEAQESVLIQFYSSL